jgi:hypothetical protein
MFGATVPSCVTPLWRVAHLERTIIDAIGGVLCPACTQQFAELLGIVVTMVVIGAVAAGSMYVSTRARRTPRLRTSRPR